MLQRLRDRSGSESGFTLVELLVVMLIIGLLAAIAIPSFFNQRDKARDADAKTVARTAQTAMETYSTDNNGVYTGANVAALVNIEETLSDDAGTLTVASSPDAYSITATSTTGNTFTIARLASGQTNLTCVTGGDGGCPTGGVWD